jgi:hypothetical protein
MRLDTIHVTQYGTAVYLKGSVLWDVTPCGLLYRYKLYGGSSSLHIEGCPRRLPGIPNASFNSLKMEARSSSRILVIFYWSTWDNIPEYLKAVLS